MARIYDSRTTIFSPEGRLYQVEYATEAINRTGTCLGILANDGIVLLDEKRNTNALLDDSAASEKIFKLNENVICSLAGVSSDANVIINELRLISQRYLLQYGGMIPCEQLVSWMCDIKQAYTQFGGKRPFGVQVLYAGWDKHHGFQLYKSEPSGNYSGWKAACIGRNSPAALTILETHYKPNEMTIDEALTLGIKVFGEILEKNKFSTDTIEIATLQRNNGKCLSTILSNSEVQRLIDTQKKSGSSEKIIIL